MGAAPGTTVWTKIHAYLNTLNHMLIFAVTIYITFTCWYMGLTSRSLHVWLCTMGYQLLMAESILAFSTANSCTLVHTRRTNSHLHWILQLLGAILSFTGFAFEYVNRTRHFGSVHSTLGIISLSFLCLSMANGIAALFAADLKSIVKPVYSKLFHNSVGTFCFFIGMLALIYGYDKGTMVRASTPEIRGALQVATGMTIVLSLYMASSALYSQFKDVVRNRVRLPSISEKFYGA